MFAGISKAALAAGVLAVIASTTFAADRRVRTGPMIRHVPRPGHRAFTGPARSYSARPGGRGTLSAPRHPGQVGVTRFYEYPRTYPGWPYYYFASPLDYPRDYRGYPGYRYFSRW